MKRGYQLPFYADLSRMPEMERKVIWGMMVGEEGKTKIPVLQNYTERGFNPEKHRLQSYGTGWQSASFLPQESMRREISFSPPTAADSRQLRDIMPEEKRQIMRKPFPSEKSARKTFSGKSAGFTRLCMWKTVWTGAS